MKKRRLVKVGIALPMMAVLMLANCGRPSFRSVVSDKEVVIVQAFLKNNDERLVILLPVGLELDLNHKQVKDVGLYFYVDGQRLVQPQEFLVMNGETDEIIFAIEDLNHRTYPKHIYLLDQTMIIEPERAQELVERYSPGTSLERIKSREDTIKLASYRKFREDYPEFVEKMQQVPDSVILSLALSGGKTQRLTTLIDW